MTAPLKTIGDKSVLYVMAAKAEYGPALRQRISPLMTGVGPVEAAVALSNCLTHLEEQSSLPDLVVSLGSAGSRTLNQTEIYQASSVSYRDMDASALGFEKGCTPFLDLPAEIPLPFELPGVPTARLSTGAAIVSGADYDQIDADMVDMESFALLRACQRVEVPMIALRGISDGAEALNRIDDWTQYLHIIDEKLALTIDQLEAAIRNATLKLPA